MSFNIDELVSRLTSGVPAGLQTVKSDLEHTIAAYLQSALTRLDLVTREEFDVQSQVLARTRQKLEDLEKRVTYLEQSDGSGNCS